MISWLRVTLLSVLLATFSGLAFATPTDDPDDPPPDTLSFALPEVEVEAARATETRSTAPFTVSVRERTPQETTLESPVFLRETFQDMPGVWMNDRGHFALGEQLVVRGMGWRSPFGVRGVQVLLDGVPLTLPDGQAFLDIVDPIFTRNAEAIRGPSSLFWGNGSGGVFFLDSTPGADAPTAQARVGGGSFGLRQFSAEAVARTDDTSWRVAVSDLNRDGHRDHSEGQFTRALLSGSLALSPVTRLNIVGAFVDQDANHPGALTREQVEDNRTQADPSFEGIDAGKQSTQAHLGANLLHEFDAFTLDATAYGGFRELENPLPFAFIAFDRIYGGVRTSASGDAGPIEWNLGIDAGLQRDDRINRDAVFGQEFTDDLILDQLETVWSTSTFGYARVPLTDRLNLTLGARVDVVDFTLDDDLQLDGIDRSGDRTFSALSPGVGLTFDAGPVLFFANYNTAFETPTTTELVNQPDQAGGFNPDLDPQRTSGFEVGTRGIWADANLQFDIAAYRLSVDDRLAPFQIEDRTYFWNFGGSTHQGVETSLEWRPLSALTLQASYTGNRLTFDDDDVDEIDVPGGPEDEDLDGNRIPGVPDHRFFVSATGELQNVWVRASVRTLSDYYADNANTAVSEGYTLTDIRIGLTGLQLAEAELRPYAEVSNLFDVTHNGSVSLNAGDDFFEPGPQRAFKLGLTMTI